MSGREAPSGAPRDVRKAAQAVAVTLGPDTKFAVVGGAACALLGSNRVTTDVDIVVPPGRTVNARRKLAESSEFHVDKRTRHTTHIETGVDIEILTPPSLFRGSFDESSETFVVDGVPVLPPLDLLNAKMVSILGRADDAKKDSDASDIRFLLAYCVENKLHITTSTVPAATNDLIDLLVYNSWVRRSLWMAAGHGGGKSLPEDNSGASAETLVSTEAWS